MNATKVIVVLIIVILLLVGGYFLFFNNNSDDSVVEENNVTEETFEDDTPTQEYAMVDVSFLASEINDAISNIKTALTSDSEDGQEVVNTEVSRLDESMEQIEDIENYIQSLDDEEYGDLKEKWQTFSDEAKTLYENIKNEYYESVLSSDIQTYFDELTAEFDNLLEIPYSTDYEGDFIKETTEEPTEESDDNNIVATFELN